MDGIMHESYAYVLKRFRIAQLLGPDLFARTLSMPTRTDEFGNRWQYHSRSDHHSKVACALIMLDLLENCPALATHVREGKVMFGINHEMRDFAHNRKKNLDLVISTPASGQKRGGRTLLDICDQLNIPFSAQEFAHINTLPALEMAPVGNVLLALEAKACMTAHQKALPRLYDELNSSHQTVHGAAESAIAVGFVCINAAEAYLSPDRNKRAIEGRPTWSEHRQPKATDITFQKVREIPRRSRSTGEGYDALGVVIMNFRNDGSPAQLVDLPPLGDIYHYNSMIDRITGAYTIRFSAL
jgi:hypothetical protein